MDAVLLLIVVGLMLFFLITFFFIRMLLLNYDRKHRVDVDLYHICGGTIERESFNCKRYKKTIENKDIYVLRPAYSELEFEYLNEYIMVRTKDRKRVLNFIDINGNHKPFIPTVVKKEDNEVGAIDFGSYKKEIMSRRDEELLKEGYEKYKNLGEKTRRIMWPLVIAGILMVGLIIYMIWKYAG